MTDHLLKFFGRIPVLLGNLEWPLAPTDAAVLLPLTRCFEKNPSNSKFLNGSSSSHPLSQLMHAQSSNNPQYSFRCLGFFQASEKRECCAYRIGGPVNECYQIDPSGLFLAVELRQYKLGFEALILFLFQCRSFTFATGPGA